MEISQEKRQNKLWKFLCVVWYITVVSAVFREYLLNIPLPFGGHLFLFRVMLPVVALMYIIWAVKYKYNPIKGTGNVEKAFAVLAAVMILYGAASVQFAYSLSAWFAKYSTIVYSLVFVTMYLLMAKDKKVRRNTLILFLATMLFCMLGGFVECFADAFFDTPYAGAVKYYFFDTGLYNPIFCFYNTNALIASMVFAMAVGALCLICCWEKIKKEYRWLLGLGLTLLFILSYWLVSAAMARLGLIALVILFVFFMGWLFVRYRPSVLILILVLLFAGFVFLGENYKELFQEPVYGDTSELPGQVAPGGDEGSAPEQNIDSITTAAASNRVRWVLIKNGLRMAVNSKMLGVGVGNAEPMLKEFGNTWGIGNLHCFIVEALAEFGIFVLLPACWLLFLCFKRWIQQLVFFIRKKDVASASNVVLLIGTVLTFPVLSTANSSSWGIMSMWIYLACILDITARTCTPEKPAVAEQTEQKEDDAGAQA